MPTYSYECECGQILDITHSMFDEPDIECDNCDSMMRRKLSAPIVTFKGSGFYSTDK